MTEFAPRLVQVDDFHDMAEAVGNALALASDDALQSLVDEDAAAPDRMLQEGLPRFRVIDDAGRPFTAALLRREPGTDHFTIILTTADQT